MGKFTGYMIVTDYDGSFAEHGEVSAENAAAVRYFQENGGLFTIASGRGPEFLFSKRASFVPNAPIVSINGTLISDPADMHALAEYPLDEAVLDALCTLTERAPIRRTVLFGADQAGTVWVRGETDVPVRKFFACVPRPWYKGMMVQDASDTPAVMALAQQLYGGRYALNCSWPEGIELHALGTGKGECLEFLRRWSGLKGLTIIGVGDYENDLSLIRMADIGIAVENAVDSLKQAADCVTIKNTDNAIAHIIHQLDRA